jgi:hypothetical protein
LLFKEELELEILEKEEIKRIISEDKNFKSSNENSESLKAKEDAWKQRLREERDKEDWSAKSRLFYLILIHACN